MRGMSEIQSVSLNRLWIPAWRRLFDAACVGALLLALVAGLTSTASAKYASIVVDAKTGRILHATNADTRNYPASLTKTMTLFMVFEALNAQTISMNTRLRVTARAARQPASRLGLKRGQTITVEDAILALVTKSANDVATVIAENLAGSERKFALRMTAMARRIGMSRTTFRNASGLPHRGQMSTARDMAIMARALLHRHSRHYHYFSTKSFSYDGRRHKNHNKLLVTYKGADGIKTGYIRASGFNLMASAVRGNARLIGIVFGGNSSRHRNKVMTQLLNKGFGIIDGRRPQSRRIATTLPAPRKAATRRASRQSSPPPTRRRTAAKASPKTTSKTSWGVQVGAYARYAQAYESARAAVDLAPRHLSDGAIKIVPLRTRRGKTLYRSRIQGLAKRTAYAACRALERRSRDCMELRIKDKVQLAANIR